MDRTAKKAFYDFGDLRILVVDDQEDVRRGLQRLLRTLGCEVKTCASGEDALAVLETESYDLVFTDLKMQGISGADLLREINRRWRDVDVVLITGYGTIELAVSCLQNGALHFITKPFDNQEILSFVERTGYRILSRRYAQSTQARYKSGAIIAADRRMLEVLELIDQIAPTRVPVLIEGASGTGKELVAREIHRRSAVHDKPFLAINCIALPDTLLESELFGYRRGAFTGAHKDSRGLFEQVNGGTIFLDEVPSMSMMFQGKLLRVLEEKVVRPLGSSENIPVDFRLIAAANRNLEEMVKRGEFREDLFYRLQVMKIALPSLNERPECIPALAEYFLKRASNELLTPGEPCPAFSPAALEALQRHTWTGNVRELENTIQRALIICKGDKILPSHLGIGGDVNIGQELFDNTPSYERGKRQAIEAFQQKFVRSVLKRTNGNVSRAAELCGLTRAALQRIMRKLEIDNGRGSES